MGAEDYLPKPFNPVLLKARIFSSFEKKRLRDLERERLLALDQKTQRLEFEQLKTEKLMLNIYQIWALLKQTIKGFFESSTK